MDNRVDESQEQRHQSVRKRRFGIAVTTYALWVALILFLDWFDLVVYGSMWMIAGMVATNIVFWLLFATGANLRFSEPSLSAPMMLAATTWAAIFAGAVPEVRGASLVVFMMIMLFGIFNLRMREYLFCWGYAVLSYAVVVWYTLPRFPGGVGVEVEVMYLVLLAITLFWAAFFGYYVGRLRDRLSTRNAELRDALALVENLAIRDDLTGLHNRRYLMETLGREQQRALRHGSSFSLLMLDIDDFKSINDTKGHAAGDEVLRGFVGRLRDHIRGVDVVGRSREPDDSNTIGRFGGEEFMVVLPDTGVTGAYRVAERIRTAIAGESIPTSEGAVPITVSIGVAEYRRGESVRDLLERVDRAMYAAKHSGRDRVAAAAPDPDGTPMLYPADGSGSATSTDSGK